jgi:hypothetical protein
VVGPTTVVGLTALVIAQVPAGRIVVETGQAQVPAIEAEVVVTASATAAFLPVGVERAATLLAVARVG